MSASHWEEMGWVQKVVRRDGLNSQNLFQNIIWLMLTPNLRAIAMSVSVDFTLYSIPRRTNWPSRTLSGFPLKVRNCQLHVTDLALCEARKEGQKDEIYFIRRFAKQSAKQFAKLKVKQSVSNISLVGISCKRWEAQHCGTKIRSANLIRKSPTSS